MAAKEGILLLYFFMIKDLYFLIDGGCGLVVLLCEDCRTAGYDLLCPKKEEQADFIFTSLSSHDDAYLRVDRR